MGLYAVSRNSQSIQRALVIGLGGGCLPMYLHHVLGFQSTRTVELDPAVAGLAAHFGFKPDERLQVRCTACSSTIVTSVRCIIPMLIN